MSRAIWKLKKRKVTAQAHPATFLHSEHFPQSQETKQEKKHSAEVKYESLKAILPQQAMWERKVCQKLHDRNSPKPTGLD